MSNSGGATHIGVGDVLEEIEKGLRTAGEIGHGGIPWFDEAVNEFRLQTGGSYTAAELRKLADILDPAVQRQPIGYLCRHVANVREAEKYEPGVDTSYLWKYTHGVKDLERFESYDHLEVKRVYE